MGRSPDPKRYALWRDHVRRQETSGLTIVEFCDRECIARSKFYAWKRRFRLMGPPDQCSTLPALLTFLPVTVRVLERGPEEPLPIEIDLPNGTRLRIPTANPRVILASCPRCRRSQDRLRRLEMISLPQGQFEYSSTLRPLIFAKASTRFLAW
jgi:hypothetical protein